MPPRDPAGDAAAPLTDAEFAALMAPLGPFGPAPRLAAGVSGGPHSLALALLAARWARARGGSLLGLVVDHGLRPESGAEAEAVAAMLAGRAGIAARVLRLEDSPPTGPGGLQAWARAGRFRALGEACRASGTPWLLLGHHRADQAETLLLRAFAGSGATGLAAIARARPATEALVLRPLLDVAPGRLEAVVAAAGLPPVRDPSNAEPRFTRVRLRRALGDTDGLRTAALAEAAEAFARRRVRQAAAVAERLAAAAHLLPEGWAELDRDALGVDAVADVALAALLRAVGGAAHAPSRAATAALRARSGGGTLAGAWLAPCGGARGWRVVRAPSEAGAGPPPVPARLGAQWDGRFRMTGPGDPGCRIEALGPDSPRLRRLVGRRLPAAVLSALPVVRREGMLVAVPALLYPDRQAAARFAMVFAPRGGCVAGT